MNTLPVVLIVDYDPKTLQTLQDVFTEDGYQVETAKDGVAALALFYKLKPAIVLLEAMIPKKHGFEVCQEIKKSPLGRTTPVVIMTGVYKGRKYRTQAMRVHGCDEFVEKPCSPESLLEIIKRFVPPGIVSRPAPATASLRTEKLGTVIPFPADRIGYTLPDDIDEDAEREIMSKLDEIMPNTPMFKERGVASATLAVEAPPAPAIETVSKLTAAVAVAEEPEPIITWPAAPEDSSRGQTNAGSGKTSAMQSDDVMAMLKPRGRSAASASQADAPTAKRRRFSALSIALIVISALVIVASYIVSRF